MPLVQPCEGSFSPAWHGVEWSTDCSKKPAGLVLAGMELISFTVAGMGVMFLDSCWKQC